MFWAAFDLANADLAWFRMDASLVGEAHLTFEVQFLQFPALSEVFAFTHSSWLRFSARVRKLLEKINSAKQLFF